MSRTRRLSIDGNGTRWFDGSSDYQFLQFQSGQEYATLSLSDYTSVQLGGSVNIGEVVVWRKGVVSFGPVTNDQINFMQSYQSGDDVYAFPGDFVSIGVPSNVPISSSFTVYLQTQDIGTTYNLMTISYGQPIQESVIDGSTFGDNVGEFTFAFDDISLDVGDFSPAEDTAYRVGYATGFDSVLIKPQSRVADSRATAVEITGPFSLADSPNIGDSTEIPHFTVHATGNAHAEFYSFTAEAGQSGTFAIDNANFDTVITLTDANGAVLAFNDDTVPFEVDPGSNNVTDSFLRYDFEQSGTYYLIVQQYSSPVLASVPNGSIYDLNISLSGAATPVTRSVSEAFVVQGTNNADTLAGREWNESIRGLGGADVLTGGGGIDRFYYSSISDSTPGAFDRVTDFVSGEDYVDLTQINVNNFVILNSGAGYRLIYSTASGTGEIRFDRPIGLYDVRLGTFPATNADNLVGGAANDVLAGLGGDDTLSGGLGGDVLDGGAGVDLASYASASARVIADLYDSGQNAGDAAGDSYLSIEGLVGSNFADILRGSTDGDRLYGGDGNDVLIGNYGSDRLDGGGGDDVLYSAFDTVRDTSFENGNDLFGGDGNDILTGAHGSDAMHGGAGIDSASYATSMRGVIADLQFAATENVGDAQFDTYDSIENLIGSGFGDQLRGDAGNNRITAGSGDDYVFGRNGDDRVEGNDGTDALFGEAGSDALFGGAGFDILVGGDGTDYLDGGASFDILIGGSGLDFAMYSTALAGVTADLQFTSANSGDALGDMYLELEGLGGSELNDNLRGDGTDNYLFGNGGADLMFGRDGADSLYGGAGADTLLGDAGADSLFGGIGDDNLIGGVGADILQGDEGVDLASYQYATGSITADLQFAGSQNSGEAQGDRYTAIEGLTGSAFVDSLRGDQNDNRISGGDGGDVLFGRDGNDVLAGDSGTDLLFGDAGADALSGGDGDDYLYGGAGADSLNGNAGFDYASYAYANASVIADLQFAISQNFGEASGDSYANVEGLVGSAFMDSIRGDQGSNYLWGNAGNDALFGRDGNDVLIGGSGADTLSGGNGSDIFIMGFGDGTDVISDIQAGNGAGDVISLSTALGVFSYADVMARASQVGADTLITFNATTSLLVQNVSPFGLAVDDFVFV